MRKPARIISLALLAIAATILILRERQVTISAADSESITWGAVEPTWSPDGKQIAFSLFGSIWRVPAEGGDYGGDLVAGHRADAHTDETEENRHGETPQQREPHS